MASSNATLVETDQSETLDNGFFPFPIQLSLKPAITHWRKYAQSDHFFHTAFSDRFEQTLKEHPFLLEPIEDVDRLKGLEDFLEILFEPILPRDGWSNVIQAASAPFMLHPPIAGTERFYSLLGVKQTEWKLLDSPPDLESLNCRTLGAYGAILHKYYNVAIPFDFPIIVSYTNTATGLTRYFKAIGMKEFIGIHRKAPLPKLSKQTLQQLVEQPFDFALWKKLLPPENFLFSGVNLLSLVDVTTEESTARLQSVLLEKWDGNETEQFHCLQRELRNLFRLPNLRLGLATLQYDGHLNFTSTRPLWNSLLLRDLPDATTNGLTGSLYEKVLNTGKPLIIGDLEKHAGTLNRAEKGLLEQGCRTLLLVPLLFDEQRVGILELTAPTPGGINGMALLKINQIKPVFSNAVKRHREEFENRVESAMMKRYTAIHPAIQWRFRQATIRQFDQQNQAGKEEIIQFENVFPFYGSLDVRASSNKRNQAVHRDLVDNLGAARDTFNLAYEMLSFSFLQELAFKTERKLNKLQDAFQTGDEPGIAEFIRQEINPALEHIGRNYPQTSELIHSAYFKNLNPGLGIFSYNRQAYEEAMMLINQTIVAELEEEEVTLQKLFPCYFEKYQTDGVEYNIYTGASIAPHREFDNLYLDNIRLRQLSWTCRIMHKVNELQPYFKKKLADAQCITPGSGCDQLPAVDVSLEIAPLILAFGSPITLRFRMDEKRLDVDGSYNIRYEIIKKRIDKALIKGSKERLTQPGQIAIVYAREREAAAYRSHMEYLCSLQYVTPEVEDLELEPLQGVEGLKALRIKLFDMTGEKSKPKNARKKT